MRVEKSHAGLWVDVMSRHLNTVYKFWVRSELEESYEYTAPNSTLRSYYLLHIIYLQICLQIVQDYHIHIVLFGKWMCMAGLLRPPRSV